MYEVVYSDEVLLSIKKYKKSSPQSYKKVVKLINELHEHPRTGTGHPEALKGMGGNVYSREINKKDRLVYEIYEEHIRIHLISAEGHYNDR